MGCAVAALHYTGMAGVHASLDPTATMPEGATLLDLMLPAYIFGTIILATPLVALVLARQSADTEVDEAIATWSAEINDAVPYPVTGGRRPQLNSTLVGTFRVDLPIPFARVMCR